MPSRDDRIALLSEDIQRCKRLAVLLVSWRNQQEQATARGIEHLKNLAESIAHVEQQMQKAQFDLDKLQLEPSPADSPANPT